MLLLDVELFTDIHTFIDVVVYPPLKLIMELVFFAELLESFEIFALLQILEPDITDECPDPIDVISQTHNTDDFYKN